MSEPDPLPRDEAVALPFAELRTSSSALLSELYAQLHLLAGARMAQERPGHLLQTTALVHEAYLRLQREGREAWASRAQFFSAAAEAMRRILVEHARRSGRKKHGAGVPRLSLQGIDLVEEIDLDQVLQLDEALQCLEQRDGRAAEIVRLRFFAGLGIEETAETLQLSERTIKREWAFARAWLFDRLSSEP